MPLTAGARLGAYEIVSSLGAGGMGEVYRARDGKLGRDVAIKVLPDALVADPVSRARFEREAQAVAALSHPNILGIFDFGVERDIPFAVLELLDGRTLREHLNEGPLTSRKTIEYALQIAAGIGAAHASGVVHRDLKPENVFLTRDGRIKILDFGLARVTDTAEAAQTMRPTIHATSPGTVLGTVGYMSPEQVRGRDVDQRSDIFSFGAILYEMFCGRRAFTGESPVETMNAILKEDPPELTHANAELPPAFDRIVRRCLEKNPDERFQSARDVAFALDALSTTRSDTLPAIQPAAHKPRRTRAIAAIGAIAVVASIATIAFVAGVGRSNGSQVRLTRLTFDRGTIRSARFTPDGKTIVYGAAWGGRPIRVFQTRLGSLESVPLQLPDADVLSVSPSGELALAINRRFAGWIGRGTLARAPLVGGSPREELEGVSFAEWSQRGDALAIARRVDGKDRLEFPIGHVLYETSGYISHIRISPSSDVIAFLDHPIYNDNRGSVATVTLAGQFQRLTPEWAAAEGLSWASDGREIWYTANNGKGNEVRSVTLSGVSRDVWSAPTDLTILDVSPDGRALVTANALRTDVKLVAPGETQERDVSWFAWAAAHYISPDGQTLLMTRYDEGAGIDYQVGLRRVDGSSAVTLGPGEAIALSPDGKWAVSVIHSHPGLAIIPTGPGERRVFATDGFVYWTAGWFPDGKRILFIAQRAGESPAAYVQDLDGSTPRKLPSAIPNLMVDLGVKVSPDGEWFFGNQESGTTGDCARHGRRAAIVSNAERKRLSARVGSRRTESDRRAHRR